MGKKALTGIFYNNKKGAIDKMKRKEKYEQKSFNIIEFNNGYLVVSEKQADEFDKNY